MSGTRRSTILKRRSSGSERLILFLKRFGLASLAALAVGGVGYWAVESGALARATQNAHSAILDQTADWGFAVKNIMVDGRRHTDVATLKAIINLEKGDPVFSFKPEEMKVMIEKLSWVKAAHVERRLPDTIYIKLEERTPIALWQRHKRLSVVDAEGVVLTDRNLQEFRDLLIVIGDEAPQHAAALLSMLAAEPAILERVEAATLISGRRWDLKLKSGADVKLPEDELGLALRRLAVNHEEENILDKDVVSIDVRDQGRITVRTKPGAASDFNAGLTPAAGSAI